MNWKITIGKFKLMMLESLEVTHSVELLSDIATIVLPGSVYNKALEVESKIKRGDAVNIQIGYDGLTNEFDGYLESIAADDGSIKLRCEDPLFLYRVALPNKEIKNASLADILAYVHQTVKGFTVNCDYSFKYDKFVVYDATGYDVLKKIQDETNANIYLKGNVLHIHPQYTQIFGTEKYDFAKNIESSDLKYRLASDRKYLVRIESRGRDGKLIAEEAGTTGGDKFTIKISGVTDKASLKKRAAEALATKQYTGHEGAFTGWLLPFCDAGYQVKIADKDYEYKNGWYYVLEVKTTFSREGGKRVIRIGKKLKDE